MWYDLEIKVLDSNTTGNEIVNIYKNECDRSDKNAGFDLYSTKNVKIDRTGFVTFGIIARLFKVEADLKTESHFWLMPHWSIYHSGLFRGNTCAIDKNSNQELRAPVWTLGYPVTVKKEACHFQIVAPDMGWIRNVYVV